MELEEHKKNNPHEGPLVPRETHHHPTLQAETAQWI